MRQGRASGSLLVMTLWLVTILTVLSVAIAKYLSLEIKVTKYALARDQALALARGGIYLAMAELEEDDDQPPVDWLGDEWALPHEPILAGKGTLLIAIADETAKVNLNAADPKLEAALAALIPPEAAAAIAAYRTAETPPDSTEDQLDETPPYVAKDGIMMAMEELLEIPAVRQGGADLYALLHETTTLYPAAGAPINIHTASPRVLGALGLSAPTVAAVEQFRDGPDGPDQHDQDGIFPTPPDIVPTLAPLTNWSVMDVTLVQAEQAVLQGLGVESRAFAIASEAIVERPTVRVQLSAVVERGAAGAGATGSRPTIVRWVGE